MNKKIDSKNVIKKYGESAGKIYDAFMIDYVNKISQESRDAYKTLFDYFSKIDGKILEAGIGSGRNIKKYHTNASLVGVDITPEIIEKSKERAKELGRKIKLYVEDITNLPFPDNYFDAIVSTYTICVTEYPEKALKELIRVCKSGGLIGIYDCKRSDSNKNILNSQEIVAETIKEYGLSFNGSPAVVYNILSDLDKYIKNSVLKIINKKIIEHSTFESLGMYILQK